MTATRADTCYPAEARLTINVSLDVCIPPRLWASSWKQTDFDAHYFNAVLARLITDEARVQYTKAVSQVRNP